MNKGTDKEKVETNHNLNNKINYIKSVIENKLRGVTQTWGHNNNMYETPVYIDMMQSRTLSFTD
jgi:hypothetical protein